VPLGDVAIAYAVLMSKGSLPLLMAVTILAAAPAAALAGSSDVAATRRYIQANYTLVQAASTKIKAAEAALHSVLHRVQGECPNVAANSPQNPESTQLSNEVIGALVIGAYHTDIPAGTNFVRAAKGLRWSNGSLTRSVQSYVGKVKVLNTLSAPNVCADVRAWIASGYRTLPASTIRFDEQFMPNWVAIGELPQQLAPYERPDERAILRRTSQFESQLTETEVNTGVNTWDETMNTLVLQP
jgi:hypothetical protein